MSTTEEAAALLASDRPRPFERWKRRWQRVWMAMRDDDRGPPDYDEREDERRMLYGLVREFAKVSRQPQYSEGGGGNTLLKWVMGVLSVLTASAIVGGVTIYGKVSSLEATVNGGLKAHEQRIDRLERATERR